MKERGREAEKDREKKLEELQIYEQNLQSILLQKQVIQAEQNEINNALKELERAKDECFKIVGGIMIKESKANLSKELEERKKLLELRLKSFDKQEELIRKKANELREELLKEMKTEA
ncbi:MAG: prefoldin subunit beta [Candidatus Pacearchaeota archaeon]